MSSFVAEKIRHAFLKRVPETVISLALFGILSICFLINMAVDKTNTVYSVIAAALMFLLFSFCLVICVFKTGKEIRKAASKKAGGETSAEFEATGQELDEGTTGRQAKVLINGDVCIIIAACIVFYIVTLVATGLIMIASGRDGSFFDLITNRYSTLDSTHYLYIAEHGYTPSTSEDYGRVVEIVFLPGYPLLVRLIGMIIRNYYIAAMAVSFCSFVAAAVLLYLLMIKDFCRSDAMCAVVFLLTMPGAFFYIAPMTESLFLALTLGAVLAIRNKKWLAAGLCGMYSAFTKSLGTIIVVIFVFELFKDMLSAMSSASTDQKNAKLKVFGRYCVKLLPVLLVAAGFGAYLIYNKILNGDFFSFAYYEKKQWNQTLNWFFNTASYSMNNSVKYLAGLKGKSRYIGFSVFIMNLVAMFSILGTLALKRKKIRASYMIYAILYFAVAYGVTWLLSGIRYMDGLFVMPMALGAGSGELFLTSGKDKEAGNPRGLARRRALKIVLVSSMAMVSAVYFMMFCLKWQIW